MKRWNIEEMMAIGRKLFAKIHILGIQYPGTQTPDDTNVTKAANHSGNQIISAHYLNSLVCVRTMRPLENSSLSLRKLFRMQEHCRTAREQVKLMVIDGVSPRST